MMVKERTESYSEMAKLNVSSELVVIVIIIIIVN